MSKYCYTPEGIVLEGPRALPAPWTDPRTGQTYSNLSALSDPELLAFGWYPYVENDLGSPGPYHNRVFSDFTVHATTVSRDVTYQPWPIEQVRALKDAELEAQLRQYSANEAAGNPNVGEYVKHDVQWCDEEQARLFRLTDWNEVAAFDTVKPAVVTLSNNFVGARYAQQGLGLTAENTAAVDSGESPLFDQVKVNAFVSGNQAAADDPSGATAPVDPDYTFRQRVAKVSERYHRIIIWRYDVEGETNPSLDRSMAMQMENRQDSRDLYAFIYTDSGAVYLGWKKFEDQGNGIWKWNLDKTSDGAYMWRTDEMIAFILTYGTEPSVKGDYFTDLIQFPTGREERSIRVAWDPV